MRVKPVFGKVFAESMSARIAVAAAGALLLVAFSMNARWFDSHILPDFFVSRQTQWTVASIVRVALVLGGLLLFAVAGKLRRCLSAQARFAVIITLGAATTAIISSEIILRTFAWQPFQARKMHREPQRQADAHLGWRHVPGHAGSDWIGGRLVNYAFDSHGYRVDVPGVDVDPAKPTILFTGESVMTGFGLDWRETVPAMVQARLGIQSANLAVTGYSTDQSLLRLQGELPRFRCPVAVVSIFMTDFLDRNINTDRPHLDAGLNWHPPRVGWRLMALARHALAYRSAGEIDEGVAMTAAVLRKTKALAQARRARMIILVPAFMPESPVERMIRQRVLDDARLDYIFVPLDPHWRIAGDDHPDMQGARAMASAIVASLKLMTTKDRKDREPCNSM